MNGAYNIMERYCTSTQSGLTQAVRDSTISTVDAQAQLLAYIQQRTVEKKAVLAGNSVHVDRQFLCQEMPAVIDWLHYRIVDVSTIKELAARWKPNLRFNKKMTHRALDDILESIGELKFYKRHLFKLE